jgi:hypothetical protein
MAMATLTIMFPDDHGIELTIRFEQDEQFVTGIEVQKICLAGETADFSGWLSESAIAVIEQMLMRENDSAFLCCMAVDYENAA